MSIENPTIEGEKPIPSLSEQFKSRRKDKLEKQDEKTRADLKDLFNRYQSGSERVKAIRNRLESSSHLLSEEQKGYLFSSIENVANIIDENEFLKNKSSD